MKESGSSHSTMPRHDRLSSRGRSGANMTLSTDLLSRYANSYESRRDAEMSVAEFLEGCKDNPGYYASAAERILAAIGEPIVINTAKDSRLGRIFMNRTIRTYPAFQEFYGMEDTVERIVSYFRHAAQ